MLLVLLGPGAVLSCGGLHRSGDRGRVLVLVLVLLVRRGLRRCGEFRRHSGSVPRFELGCGRCAILHGHVALSK